MRLSYHDLWMHVATAVIIVSVDQCMDECGLPLLSSRGFLLIRMTLVTIAGSTCACASVCIMLALYEGQNTFQSTAIFDPVRGQRQVAWHDLSVLGTLR